MNAPARMRAAAYRRVHQVAAKLHPAGGAASLTISRLTGNPCSAALVPACVIFPAPNFGHRFAVRGPRQPSRVTGVDRPCRLLSSREGHQEATMAEPKQDGADNVLTDKEKFQQHPDKEKIAHMGDKPGQAQDRQQSPKSPKK